MKQIYTPRVVGGRYGVTCIFPTLQDIIDYEEKRRVPDQGYPRFIPHPFVVEIQQKHVRPGCEVFVVQSYEAALHIYENYLDAETKEHTDIKSFEVNGNFYGVMIVFVQYANRLRDDITNTGIVLNARKANRILHNLPPPPSPEMLYQKLSRLEKGSQPKLTYCLNSGMAAIYSSVCGLLKRDEGIVVIGSTYVDSRKIFTKLPERFSYKQTIFMQRYQGESFPEDTGLVFLEIPSNPLLYVEDLKMIVEKAHAVGALVMVDSTIATPWHFSPLVAGADIVVHSSSKSLSGRNDHLGGVLFVQPDMPQLADRINPEPFGMDEEELQILMDELADFPVRIAQMFKNAAQTAVFLSKHPEVEKVYYPEGLNNGNSHVISFELKEESLQRAAMFYDHCNIEIKAPSMGYEKTMLMPFSLVTQYNESKETLAKQSLTRYLMRLSVGTEKVEDIIGHLENGLSALSTVKVNERNI